MKRVYRFFTAVILTAWVVCFSVTTLSANPQARKDFTKNIKKEFPISETGKVHISNRYGKVEINTWEKSRVKVDVLITVRAGNEERAQIGFDRIKIDFSNNTNYVSAKTTINEGEKSFWEYWTSSWEKIDFTIDYRVHMPASCKLDLVNKYGDSYISELLSDVQVDVKYGNFEMEETTGDLEVTLGYGNGVVERAANIAANGKYCSLKVNRAENVNINSKYSKIKIEEAAMVKTISKYDSYSITKATNFENEGKYDHFEIGLVNDVLVISKYADINVERLLNSANFELKYGGARVDDVDKGFSEINLVGKNADYKINVEEGAAYQVKATTDYAGLNYPSNMKVIFVDEDGAKREVNAYIGEKNAKGIIKAHLDYGGLKVW